MNLPAYLLPVAGALLVQCVALVGAVWALRQATLSVMTVRRFVHQNGRRIAARLMMGRAITTLLLLVVIGALAVMRISGGDVTREATGTIWAVHLLLALAQLGAAQLVLGDVYERWRLRRHYHTTPAAQHSRIEQEEQDHG